MDKTHKKLTFIIERRKIYIGKLVGKRHHFQNNYEEMVKKSG